MDPQVTDALTAAEHRPRILLIEADFLARWQAGEYLRETGFEVLEAVSAAEGLAAIRAGSPLNAVFCACEVLLGAAGEALRLLLEGQHTQLPVLVACRSPSGAKVFDLPPTWTRIDRPYALEDIERRLRALISGH